MRPYIYKITNTRTGRIYVGSQYGQSSNPENLLKKYFTSSKSVIKEMEEYGKDIFTITRIKETKHARKLEARYLKRMYHRLGKDLFMTTFMNRNISPGILLDADSIKKMNDSKKEGWSSGRIKKPRPPDLTGKSKSSHMRQSLSNSLKGHTVSEETRDKIRKSLALTREKKKNAEQAVQI